MNDQNEMLREKLIGLLTELNIPDPADLKNLIQTSKMSFEKFVHFKLENFSTLNLLERAELIAQLLQFSTDTKRIQKTISQDLNITFRYTEIEESTIKFLTELESLNAKTSSSLERDFDIIKEYGIMQDLPKLTLVNPKKLKDNYICKYNYIFFRKEYGIQYNEF